MAESKLDKLSSCAKSIDLGDFLNFQVQVFLKIYLIDPQLVVKILRKNTRYSIISWTLSFRNRFQSLHGQLSRIYEIEDPVTSYILENIFIWSTIGLCNF